jgi:hypothetical protein
LVRLQERADTAAQAHFHDVNDLLNRADGLVASSRARVEMQLYQALAEVPLRHAGWALLECEGEQGDVPMLSRLQSRLAASPYPIARFFARHIDPQLRNAAAHQLYHWDWISEELCLESGVRLDLNAVVELNRTALAVVQGFELGCRAARCVLKGFAQNIDQSVRRNALALVEARCRNCFAVQGLRVWSFEWDGCVVTISIDDPSPKRHQVVRALQEASVEAPMVNLWRVTVDKGASQLLVWPEPAEQIGRWGQSAPKLAGSA